MPVVATDLIYELIVSGNDGFRDFNNVLYYFNDDPTPADPASADLLTEFGTVVLGPWLALINDRINIIQTSARRLNNLTDFATSDFSVFGGITGDSAPSFVAFHFNKTRLTKETRSGWLHVMGVSEIDTSPGGEGLTATALTRADNLAAVLEATLTPTTNSFDPVIVGNKYDYTTDPPTLRDESQWIYNGVAGFSSAIRVSSQVSRKL